jgi:hypothetical protein
MVQYDIFLFFRRHYFAISPILDYHQQPQHPAHNVDNSKNSTLWLTMDTIQDEGTAISQPMLEDKKETATTLTSFEIETDLADQPANRRVEDPDVAALDPVTLETQTLLSTATHITKDWLASGVIGFFVVSYWRGTWTLFDIWYVQCTPALLSCLGGSAVSKLLCKGVHHPSTALSHTLIILFSHFQVVRSTKTSFVDSRRNLLLC